MKNRQMFFLKNLLRQGSGLFLLILLLFSCKKENITQKEQTGETIFGVNSEVVYQSNVEKTRQKTSELYISLLYSNLFQTNINSQDLSEITGIRLASGDKQMADELFLNAFVNSDPIIPTNAAMRDDIDQFITDTYLRFFLRLPTAYEVFDLEKIIEEDPDLTPILIYQGFALSNEYKFY